MAWSGDFSTWASPISFYPSLNITDWNTKAGSTTAVPSLDQLLTAVVDRINTEARNISPNYSTTLDDLWIRIPGNYNGMNYQQRFQALVDAGREALKSLRNASVNNANFTSFYQRYYFYTPTSSQLQAIKNHFLNQDYGFGAQGSAAEKSAAMNRMIQAGLLPANASLETFESFTADSNRAAVINQVLALNGSADNPIIDPERVKAYPIDAADALMRLKEEGKLKINSNGKYEWTNTGNWRELERFAQGTLFNNYQNLLRQYELSGEGNNGVTLSQYIASKNKTVFNQLVNSVANAKLSLDQSSSKLNDAKAFIESSMQKEMDKAVLNLGKGNASAQEKIALLRADAFKQVSSQLALQQASEDNRKDLDMFQQSNSMFQEMAQDLGLKSDFFTNRFLQSNVEFNWQNWFEQNLRERYDPASSKNILGTLIGGTEEDARLAAGFVKDFLQRRFDASKSLSEFKEYVNPSSQNAVLEASQEKAWKNITTVGFSQLAGDINNPATGLGNFWTNLQNLWSKGRSFDASYYLNQNLSGDPSRVRTVADLQSNLNAMLDVSYRKGTSNLTAGDLRSIPLKGVNSSSDVELNAQAALFKQWFETAYANGVDLSDPVAFANLHYSTYAKDSRNSILQLGPGVRMNINDSNLISNTEVQMLARQSELLIAQASDYATEIQFGKFKTPEEYVAEMMKDSPIYKMSKDGTWRDSGLNDIIADFVAEYTGVISSYAGEAIRRQIQDAIANNQKPGQAQIGVDFIERTKDQALSTIRNLINQDAYQKAVVIDNAPGPAIGESLKDWFSMLGLELIPGDTWEKYKQDNGLAADLAYNDWAKVEGKKIDTSTNKPKSQMFWEQWATDNGVTLVKQGSAPQSGTGSSQQRMTVVVENPSSAWLSWGKRITMDTEKGDVYTRNRLNGARVSIRSDSFNSDWYSKTNPYTKVVDEWNYIVARPSQELIDTKGKPLGQWAKDTGMSPDVVWDQYREEMQKKDPKFGKSANGTDISYVSWSQDASPSQLSKFWQDSTPFWFDYLKSMGVVKSGNPEKPDFKTWSEWSIENNVELERADLNSNKPPPDVFMALHYSTMGGKSKVDAEYLKTYFPEFTSLSSSGLLSGSALANSPFDLNDFGFGDDTSVSSMQTVTQTGRKQVSPIDFAMKQMFGDSLSQDGGDPFADMMDVTKTDFSSDLGVKLDTSYNKSKTKKTNSLSDFGFGDFGGSNFGF